MPYVVGAADCTFNIEWLGYVFGIVYFILHRKIEGRWRRTVWPACYIVHPREDKRVYRKAFEAVRDDLSRRRLPPLRQMGLDHFAGLEAEFCSAVEGGWV